MAAKEHMSLPANTGRLITELNTIDKTHPGVKLCSNRIILYPAVKCQHLSHPTVKHLLSCYSHLKQMSVVLLEK